MRLAGEACLTHAHVGYSFGKCLSSWDDVADMVRFELLVPFIDTDVTTVIHLILWKISRRSLLCLR